MGAVQRVLVTAVLAAAAISGPTAVSSAAPEAPEPTCREVQMPVTLDEAEGSIAGTLCIPVGAQRLLVLIPGFTYDRSYYDLPVGDGRYSFTRAMTAAGEATFAIDRLGTGKSWRPPSRMLTYDNHVTAVGQVVTAIRSRAAEFAARSLVLVGHSFGSRVSYGVASAHPDAVDAVVATSLRQNWVSDVALTVSPLVTRRANEDPKFSGLGLDDGYVTAAPGRRATFFNLANLDDPGVLDADEQHRDVGGELEPVTAREAITSESNGVNVPVMVMVGSADLITCGPASVECPSESAVAERERALFGPRAQVAAAIMTGSGHNFLLERDRSTAWRVITDFLARLKR